MTREQGATGLLAKFGKNLSAKDLFVLTEQLFSITRPAGGEHCSQADSTVLCVIMNSAS